MKESAQSRALKHQIKEAQKEEEKKRKHNVDAKAAQAFEAQAVAGNEFAEKERRAASVLSNGGHRSAPDAAVLGDDFLFCQKMYELEDGLKPTDLLLPFVFPTATKLSKTIDASKLATTTIATFTTMLPTNTGAKQKGRAGCCVLISPTPSVQAPPHLKLWVLLVEFAHPASPPYLKLKVLLGDEASSEYVHFLRKLVR